MSPCPQHTHKLLCTKFNLRRHHHPQTAYWTEPVLRFPKMPGHLVIVGQDTPD
jgi:hypothetical protein